MEEGADDAGGGAIFSLASLGSQPRRFRAKASKPKLLSVISASKSRAIFLLFQSSQRCLRIDLVLYSGITAALSKRIAESEGHAQTISEPVGTHVQATTQATGHCSCSPLAASSFGRNQTG